MAELSDATRDMDRAVLLLIEELEAIDCRQRANACKAPVPRSAMLRA